MADSLAALALVETWVYVYTGLDYDMVNLDLKSDATFTLGITDDGISYDTQTGTWSVTGNTLVLNYSDGSSESMIYNVNAVGLTLAPGTAEEFTLTRK